MKVDIPDHMVTMADFAQHIMVIMTEFVNLHIMVIMTDFAEKSNVIDMADHTSHCDFGQHAVPCRF